MKRNVLRRILCAILCAAMLLSMSAMSLYASDAEDDDPAPAITLEDAAPDDADPDDAALDNAASNNAAPDASAAPAAAPAQQATAQPSFFARVIDFFFGNFGFIGFIFDPYQFTIINQKPVFQWAFGFNDIYDIFTWVVNVWADTMKCEFNYDGRDWRLQFWKGGYGLCLATGGEIGVYTKPEGFPLEHYNAPVSQDDWLYLTYTIYNKGEELFTRPSPLIGDEGPYWWAPGYRILSICTDFFSSPRTNVVMNATITFKDNAMARAFMAQLAAKEFTELAEGRSLGLDTPECYQLKADRKSVQFIWQNINEGFY